MGLVVRRRRFNELRMLKLKIKDKFIKIADLIRNNEVVNKTFKNAGWLIGDKVFYMAIGVFVTAIVARYFGPENFGQFNYALAFVALFTAISTLGMETLTVKSIIDDPGDEGTILCTSLFLRLCGGILLTFLAIAIIKIIEPADQNLHILVLIISLTMVLKSFEVIEYWIQAYQKAKISSLIRMSSYVIISLLKIFMVIFKGTLVTYALIYMVDVAIIGIALTIAYFKIRDKTSPWKISLTYARNILSQSWYLIISGLMVTLYMRIDQVMLGSMMPDRVELGVYSAAVRVAEMWYFVPTAIITSFKPVIMDKKLKNENSYLRTVQILYTIIAWTGIVFGILILLFSKPIIFILYGTDYMKAASILSVSVWAGTFATLGSARFTWLICERLQHYTMVYTAAGLIINIIANYLLIPVIGGYGAAIATLLAQFVNILTLGFFKETRISTIMIFRAFVFR